ncbi:MAG TPA: hypothetical protein DCX07_02185 [Phycisphaerales bacterium]|nr:hypothetical protein [Phycisphaerales bacterium]
MPKPKKKTTSASDDMAINLTPMIDCTFQLIIFFIIASQSASQMLAKLTLPKLVESQAIPEKEIRSPDRVIVNVQSAEASDEREYAVPLPGQASRYVINGQKFKVGDIASLEKLLTDRRKAWEAAGKQGEFYVEIRADHRVAYSQVAPIMEAAAEAGVVKMRIDAEVARN